MSETPGPLCDTCGKPIEYGDCAVGSWMLPGTWHIRCSPTSGRVSSPRYAMRLDFTAAEYATTYHSLIRLADGAVLVAKEERMTCPYGDPTCPCPDGLLCHYEGPDPMTPPAPTEDRHA